MKAGRATTSLSLAGLLLLQAAVLLLAPAEAAADSHGAARALFTTSFRHACLLCCKCKC